MSAASSPQSFSVVLPTVNRGELFRSALESLIPQLELGDELIISINGPEQPVMLVLEDYIERLPKGCLRIVRPREQLTIYRHWNFALSHATKEWVVFLHDDEIVHAGLLARARREIAADSGISLITGGTMMADAREGLTAYPCNEIHANKLHEGRVWIEAAAKRLDLHYSISCYIFKRLPSYPYFENETRVADWLLMLDAAAGGKVLEADLFFSTHLLHSSNQSWVDYLTPGQIPFWRGLETLNRRHGLHLDAWVAHSRGATCMGYLRNALLAALPAHDKEGFELCLNLASEADPASLGPRALRAVLWNRAGFRVTAALAALLRKAIRTNRGKKRSAAAMSGVIISEIAARLNCSPDFVRTWLERARGFNASSPVRANGVGVS